MDSSFGRDKETSRDDKIVKQSVGRGQRVWLHGESGGLRRPHGASTASQFGMNKLQLQQCELVGYQLKNKTVYLYIEPDSSTTTMTTQHNQLEKKSALSPQAEEFVPRYMLPHTSQSPLLQSPTAESNVLLPSVSDLNYFDWILKGINI